MSAVITPYRVCNRCEDFNVGYQKFTAPGNASKMTVPTFSRVGDTTTHTLADWVPDKGSSTKAFTSGNFILYFYKSNGNQLPAIEDAWILATYPAITSDKYCKTAKVMIYWNASKEHWYLTADRSFNFIMDDYPLDKGDGFLTKISKDFPDGVSLNYNGEVDSADYPYPAPGNASTLSGNIAPADMVVSDFVPDKGTSTKSFTSGNFILYFYKSNGNQLPATEDSWITTTYPAITSDKYCKTAKVMIYWNPTKEHWYLTADRSFNFPMDNYPVKAGEGFLIKISKDFADGVTLNLPNALN